MANQIKIYYRNILETGTVTSTDENTSFPRYRLYDRDIGKLFKFNSHGANLYIQVNQGAVISYPVDRLIIPAGHTLNGLGLLISASATGAWAGEHINYASWTQADALVINVPFGPATYQYWRLVILSDPAAPPEMPEMFLSKEYIFVANPLLGGREGWQRNISGEETETGLDRDVKRGELRRRRDYELRDIASAQKTEFETMEQVCEGIKPIWILDHNGTRLYMKMLNELEFSYDTDDPVSYSCALHLREVLGQTT